MTLFKIKNFILVLLYSMTYFLCYIYFLNYYFEYLHFPLFMPSGLLLFISFIISAAPSLLYKGYKSISSFISTFIFIVLYIPTIITFALAHNDSSVNIIKIQFVYFVSMCLLFIADRVVFVTSGKRFPQIISFRSILLLTIICSVYSLYVFRGNLKLVSFANVYTLRSANIDIGIDTVTRYITAWLNSLFIPVCALHGILNKHYFYFLVGVSSSLALYMCTASKSTILMPFIMLGLYFLLSISRKADIFSSMIITLTLLMLGLLLVLNFQGMDSPLAMLASIIILRVIATGGILNVLYYEFFLDHPNTYYSHIGPINFFTNWYPYGDVSIGQVIGAYFVSDDLNANANFWASDGIASIGIIGVLVISIILFVIVVFLNTISKRHNQFFLILLFIPLLGTLLNTSLFQTMWSGGGFFITLLLLLLKTENKSFICCRDNTITS